MRTKRTYSIVEIEFEPIPAESTINGKRIIRAVNVLENVLPDELNSYLKSDDPDRKFHLFTGNEVQWKETRTIQLGEKRTRTRKPKPDAKPETKRKAKNGAVVANEVLP